MIDDVQYAGPEKRIQSQILQFPKHSCLDVLEYFVIGKSI